MTDGNINEVTPVTLMARFQGTGLKTIIVFTLVVHVVVIGASSVPYLVKSVFGANAAAMTKEERVKVAVKEATEAIRDIAADYQLNPQEISDQFTGAGSRAATVAPAEPAVPAATGDAAESGDAEPERPKSEIEKAIEVKADGPAVPAITDDIW